MKLQSGAVSGESAKFASPKGSLSQAKGQKSNKKIIFLINPGLIQFLVPFLFSDNDLMDCTAVHIILCCATHS